MAHARETEEPPGQLGVEQPAGIQPDLHQAGEVLGGGMDDPFGRCDRLPERREIGEAPVGGLEGLRIDQPGARVGATELQEIGPGRVPEALGAFRVDGHRTGTGGERLDAARQCLGGVNQLGESLMGHGKDGHAGVLIDLS